MMVRVVLGLLDDKIYAVKRVQFGDFCEEKKLKVLKEVKSLAKMDSEFVVKYYNSWLESKHLYILMEFCSQSLKSLLTDKAIVFGRQTEDQINILECVQYLHELKPPVIHRDLKPDNILIDPNFTSNRCVKLCDFGLATDHNTDGHTASRYGHTSGVGTINLCIIGEELFGINLQASKSFTTKNSALKTSILCMYRTLLAMMSTPNWRQRPECREVLAKHNEWSNDKTVVTTHKDFNVILLNKTI
ncbi:unnamed protein product [Medioppia subpectinata]|uniref:Protein kinase domain-containing protein n=1 Tax=Medioppia subpectinata TaxID=1979941 RepID=A0A7R9PY08_9ACAR|nr:unnamed protein product [Medioppia subpectinata]CAG2104935.1 unnamed protein product [Medioppia subpectinata]